MALWSAYLWAVQGILSPSLTVFWKNIDVNVEFQRNVLGEVQGLVEHKIKALQLDNGGDFQCFLYENGIRK